MRACRSRRGAEPTEGGRQPRGTAAHWRGVLSTHGQEDSCHGKIQCVHHNSGASEGCPWSAGGVRVMRGQKPRQSTSNYAEKYQEDAAKRTGRRPADGIPHHRPALEQGRRELGTRETLAPGRLRGGTPSPPSLATATTTTTATATGTASPSPEASSAWSKLSFRSVAWTQRWEGGNKK